MIRVIVQGGFGNQLFQYAMGYALAKRLNTELILDVSFFDYIKASKNKGSIRVNNLDKLNLTNARFESNPSSFKRIILGAKLHKTWLSRFLGFKYPVLWEDVANCRLFQSRTIEIASQKENAEMYGFWQNTKYFNEVLQELKEQFTPNYTLDPTVNNIKDRIAKSGASVGIHVRRGDFVGLGWAEGADYYLRAIEAIRKELGDCSFFIVSDDKDWAKEQFSEVDNAEVIDIKTPTCDIDEFFLLSLCQHQIISESTFGWWAAYLNTNPCRRVTIPDTAKGEMFPESWMRI
ncbi:MAG: alpha-1,2-fucosyltransferase [Muribaculum sp.]|nr:alpha-1,2-fucosyltransferase [Muribaculum sp.]